MSTSNARRRPAVVLTMPVTVRARRWLREWWREFNRSDAIASTPGNTDVLVMNDYRCGMCGGQLEFEPIPSELDFARHRRAIGACVNEHCRNYGVRLLVPVQVIRRCELAG